MWMTSLNLKVVRKLKVNRKKLPAEFWLASSMWMTSLNHEVLGDLKVNGKKLLI